MSVGRGNYKRTSAARRSLAAVSRTALGSLFLGALLLGCGEPPIPEEAPLATVAAPNDKVAAAIRRVLAADKAERPVRQIESQSEQVAVEPVVAPVEGQIAETAETSVEEPAAQSVSEGLPESQYFSWSAPPKPETEPELPPACEESVDVVVQDADEPPAVEPVDEVVAVEETAPAAPAEYMTTPFAVLLPPQMVEAVAETKLAGAVDMPKEKTPDLGGLSDAERRLVEQVFRETSETATGVLTDARVNEMATTSIREANALANRGARFAARQKLVEALRMISQAKDAHRGDRDHSTALAAGLRALEEAEDFAPRGTQLEGEMDVAVIVAAHRTPIAKRLKSTEVPSRLMMDLYFRYAQVKLATAVAGEPSGSMALYALGKVTSQIGHTEPQQDRLAHRHAVAFQQAALLAHNQNYFAAHELGVLMAESGRLAEAEHLLKQVAIRQPSPAVYRNLASVQQRSGNVELAATSRSMATQLAAQQPAGSGQVRWVGPEAFGASPITPTQYAGPAPMAQRPGYSGERTAMSPPPRASQQNGPVPPGSWR